MKAFMSDHDNEANGWYITVKNLSFPYKYDESDTYHKSPTLET